MIDLHVHSTFSDGTYTPTELVDYAITKNISAFALTDHDTVAGVDEAVKYAAKLHNAGIKGVPEIIPGIEFSSQRDGHDVHIVGLFVDYKSPVFQAYLDDFIHTRDERNKKMCDGLCKAGINVPYEELVRLYPDSVITRAHMARYMVEHGLVKNRNEVFEKYIGDKCPYYVPREFVTPEVAIKTILEAGGIPVLAHPILYKLCRSKLNKLVADCVNVGLIAIEAQYSTYTHNDEEKITTLAQKYHLLLSGGSDFHGSNKADIDLGTGYGNLNIKEALLEKLKLKLQNILFTDMDGTLLRSTSTVSLPMKRELDRITSLGHHVVLSSGRPLPSILEVKAEAGLNYPNMYIISNNGALIYDCSNHKPIYVKRLSQDIVRQIVNLALTENIHVHSYTDMEIVGFEDDDELKFYRKRIHMDFIKVDDIADYLPEGSYKVQLIVLNDRQRLEKFRQKIIETLGDSVEAFFSNDQYLEILPKGVDKGEAIKFVTDYLGVIKGRTFAAGDADNDITMIDAAAYGIAMKNASDNVKKAADIITEYDNNEDGLIPVLQKYFN